MSDFERCTSCGLVRHVRYGALAVGQKGQGGDKYEAAARDARPIVCEACAPVNALMAAKRIGPLLPYESVGSRYTSAKKDGGDR